MIWGACALKNVLRAAGRAAECLSAAASTHRRSLPPPLLPVPGAAEIGVGLTGLGFLFFLLGVLFFFDRGLLAMGNVSGRHRCTLVAARRCCCAQSCAARRSLPPSVLPLLAALQILFLTGVALTIGPQAALRFFARCALMVDGLVCMLPCGQRSIASFRIVAVVPCTAAPCNCPNPCYCCRHPLLRSLPLLTLLVPIRTAVAHRPKNYKGSAFFLGGVALVVWGWTFVGEAPGLAARW